MNFIKFTLIDRAVVLLDIQSIVSIKVKDSDTTITDINREEYKTTTDVVTILEGYNNFSNSFIINNAGVKYVRKANNS